jgi:hypothetical protein
MPVAFASDEKAARDLSMSGNFQQLITKYHAFYEVSPYHIVIEEGHGSPGATRRIIQAGFDVDVHGLSDKSELELPPPAEYALGYAEVKKITDAVSHDPGECFIEVIPFPSTVFSDARRHFQSEAVLRIRISHCGGIDQHAGLPEQHVLEEVEKWLQRQRITRR